MTFLCACTFPTKENEPLSRSGIYFDTYITITIYDKTQEEILDHCFDMCKKYEDTLSKTIEDSEVSLINSSKGKAVKVSEDTIEIIEKSIYYSEISEGLFDITIAPLTELWDFHENSKKEIPKEEDIKKALSHVSYKNIKIDKEKSTVALSDPEAKIDLGGIAKGYIADKLKEYLISEGVESALINLGGNIEAIGSKPDGSSFLIGIKKPFSEKEIIDSVEIKNNSVASSGVYERYFIKDDKLYHHILSPKTGYPVESDLYGASVICFSAEDADAIGTICILLGYERAKELTDSIKDLKVIWSFKE